MNQYRCETCMRRIGLIDGPDDCPIGIPYHTDVAEAYVTEKIGCASHSNFQSEREQVLDEIFKWVSDMDGGDVVFNPKLGLYSSPQPFNTVGLIHKLKELRHEGEQKQ